MRHVPTPRGARREEPGRGEGARCARSAGEGRNPLREERGCTRSTSAGGPRDARVRRSMQQRPLNRSHKPLHKPLSKPLHKQQAKRLPRPLPEQPARHQPEQQPRPPHEQPLGQRQRQPHKQRLRPPHKQLHKQCPLHGGCDPTRSVAHIARTPRTACGCTNGSGAPDGHAYRPAWGRDEGGERTWDPMQHTWDPMG
jgi:hypothetical protein